MRIIRKLPPAPPPTRARRVVLPNEMRGVSLSCETIGDAVRQKEAHRRAMKKSSTAKARGIKEGDAERRHDLVLRLARDGLSDAEIAKQTGYKPSSVHRLIAKMRHDGIDIPNRKRGVKCKK